MFLMQLISYWNNWEVWPANNDERSQSDFILKKGEGKKDWYREESYSLKRKSGWVIKITTEKRLRPDFIDVSLLSDSFFPVFWCWNEIQIWIKEWLVMKGYVDGGLFRRREGRKEGQRDFSLLLVLTHSHHAISPPGDLHIDYWHLCITHTRTCFKLVYYFTRMKW